MKILLTCVVIFLSVGMLEAVSPMVRPVPQAMTQLRANHVTRLNTAQAPVLRSFSGVRADHQAMLKTHPRNEVVKSYAKQRDEYRRKLVDAAKAENKRYYRELEHLRHEFVDKQDFSSAIAVSAEMESYADDAPVADDAASLPEDVDKDSPQESPYPYRNAEKENGLSALGKTHTRWSIRVAGRQSVIVDEKSIHNYGLSPDSMGVDHDLHQSEKSFYYREQVEGELVGYDERDVQIRVNGRILTFKIGNLAADDQTFVAKYKALDKAASKPAKLAEPAEKHPVSVLGK